MFKNFITNNSLFFDLFDQASENLVQMASVLKNCVDIAVVPDREKAFIKINRLAANGDDVTHKIHLWLNKIMFTPLNRGDIYSFTAAIDGVADMIREAGSRMYLYDADDFVPAVHEIAAILLVLSCKIKQAVTLLRYADKAELIEVLCKQVKEEQRRSDQVYLQAAAKLFAYEKDAIKLIKYREILSSLESAVNKCKYVTDVLSVMMIH